MTRILKYEMQRLLVNKFYLFFFAVNVFFAWYVLTSDIIAGVAYTAPFSQWSYGTYLSSLMPMMIMTVLFLLTSFYAKNEKRVELLTKATSVNVIGHTMIRMGVVLLAFIILLVPVIGISVYFYSSFFGFNDYADFLLPAAATVLPGLIFFLGAGFWAGSIHIGFLYALILVSLLLNFPVIPGAFDIFGKGYYSGYPAMQNLPLTADGEPLFVLTPAFFVSRLVYMVAGAALFIFSILRLNRVK